MEIVDKIDFAKGSGLVPAIIQDKNTQNVLMLGYMNEEAVKETLSTGYVVFWSRSKQRLWKKGESSGNVLKLVDMQLDCDNDSLLVQAVPAGPTCHKGDDTCWGDENMPRFSLQTLESVIKDRYDNPADTSYTASLFSKGINKVAQKVGEEAVELVIEAKDDNTSLFLNEGADLMYHFLVLLRAKGIDLSQVMEVLEDRHSQSK